VINIDEGVVYFRVLQGEVFQKEFTSQPSASDVERGTHGLNLNSNVRCRFQGTNNIFKTGSLEII